MAKRRTLGDEVRACARGEVKVATNLEKIQKCFWWPRRQGGPFNPDP